MLTDRELLELSAKAYWGDEIDDVCSVRWLEDEESIGYTHGDNQDHNGCDREFLWNPLTDDGDALRLAVKLRLDVCRPDAEHKGVCVWVDHIGDFIEEPHGDDEYAATRRAIVRSAAEIGKAMRAAS